MKTLIIVLIGVIIGLFLHYNSTLSSINKELERYDGSKIERIVDGELIEAFRFATMLDLSGELGLNAKKIENGEYVNLIVKTYYRE